MKRRLILIVLILFFITTLPINAFAKVCVSETENIIYFDNGSYITIEIVSTNTRATSTKTGTKIYTYRNSDGVEQWKATLSGTFTYNGTTSSCTASSCSVSIAKTNWYVVSKSASKSGNSATAALTMGRKLLGVTVEKTDATIRLTCDKNGNLS